MDLPTLALPWSAPMLMGAFAPDAEGAWTAQVASARRGDQAAFAQLVRRVQRPVFGLCFRLLGSEAEAADAAQEVFLRAYQNLHRYDDARPFDVWVLAIARNFCLDLLRRRSRVRSQPLEDAPEPAEPADASLEAQLIAAQRERSLEGALAHLSAEDREVLALYYVQRRTTKEIAQVLKVAPGTIMARLFRARAKLRKRLDQEEAA